MPTRRRNEMTSIDGSRILIPSRRTRPVTLDTSARSFNRLMVRNNDDFPPPAGPKKTVIALAGMENLCFLTIQCHLNIPVKNSRYRFYS